MDIEEMTRVTGVMQLELSAPHYKRPHHTSGVNDNGGRQIGNPLSLLSTPNRTARRIAGRHPSAIIQIGTERGMDAVDHGGQCNGEAKL